MRTYDASKKIDIAMLWEIKRKTLPKIPKVASLENGQKSHPFLNQFPGDVNEVRDRRIELILKALKGGRILLIVIKKVRQTC